MGRLLRIILPTLLKSGGKIKTKDLALLVSLYLSIILGGLFLIVAAFIWISEHYGYDVGFAVLAAGLLLYGLIGLGIRGAQSQKKRGTASQGGSGSLDELIPSTIRDNDSVQQLVGKVTKNPLGAIAIAFVIGTLLTKLDD